MDILPAIDILGGKVVRLQRGDYDKVTTYSLEPAQVAKELADSGAKWIHVVDLDAALSGRPTNIKAIRQIIRGATTAKIELGGGMRDDQAIGQMLDEGVARIVVGSAALKNWEWFKKLVSNGNFDGKIALGLDARDGKLAAQGWTEQLQTSAVDIARQVKGWPLGAIIYTDISRDGMMTGVNIEAINNIIEVTDVGVIASGGVSSIEDIRLCRQAGCCGAIIGKAWYEGKIDLREALRLAKA